MEKYNGWTNYATWRVNLEMFDGMSAEYDGQWLKTAACCKEWAEDVICDNTPEGLGRDYALAFLSEVNWNEIAKHYENEWLAANLSEFAPQD